MKNRVVASNFLRRPAIIVAGVVATLFLTQKVAAQIFANVPIAGMTGAHQGKVAWGDYDNDGRLDFLLTGLNDGGLSQLWRNTGSGFTNVPIAGLALAVGDSVAWGDYDNDGWLDFLNTGYASGETPQLWRNTASGFTNVSVPGLAGIQLGEVAWGDYDQDGRLDFLLAGLDVMRGDGVSELWRNTGSGFTEVPGLGLPGVKESSVAWGDYDNDGQLDFLLVGRATNSVNVTQIWRNTGAGFSNVTASVAVGLPQLTKGAVAWGDYDNDGRLDLFLMGEEAAGGVSQLWRNTSTGFTNVPIAGLAGLYGGAVAWGDYDNDGRLDFLITGVSTNGGGLTQLWRNTGVGFTNVPIAGLPQLLSSTVAWGDYDNDGRLDLLLAGSTGVSMLQLWRNNTPVTNTPPTAPTGLTVSGAANIVTLSWLAASDAQTPTNGLSYNVRVGTTPEGTDIFAGHVNVTNGFRRVPAIGNAGSRLSLTLTGIPNGLPLYWGVQAVDTAFAGGPFATNVILPPSIFAVNPPTGPTAGGIPILLMGINFATNATVTIGGNPAPVVLVNSTNTQIWCTLPAGQGTNVPVIVTSGGVASPAANFTYDQPGITNVNPSIGPTVGGITVTLAGNNFGTSGTVTIGGNPAPVVTTNWSHTQIKCVLPAGQGLNQPVIVVSGGQSSLPGNFNYAQPGITNVSPATGPTAGGAVITLRGTNFGTSGTVTIGGNPAPVVTTNWSHTQIQCVLPAGQGLNQSVVVTVGGQSSPAANFNYSGPIITNVLPALVPTPGSNTMTLWGTNFGTSGLLIVNGQFTSVAATNWSDSEIKFLSPPGQGTNIPIFMVTAGQSSPTAFYNYAPPGITNVSPPLGPELGGITVTLKGTNFGASGVVTVGTNGIPAIISGWSHGQIQFTLPPGQGTNEPVVVTVSGQRSPSVGFTYFRPAITNVSPATGPTTGGSIITLKGMYFGTNGTVTIGGSNAPVAATNWSDTQILCTLPAGQGTNVPVIVSSGGQASSPANFSYFVPGIVNVSPAIGPTLGGPTITLTGTNFGTSGTVILGGNFVPVAATNWSDTQIRFTLPAGQGTNVPIFVVVSGQASVAARFDYAAPVIATINPTSALTTGGQVMVVTGTNFGLSGTVVIGTKNASILSGGWSQNQINCFIPRGGGMALPVIVTVGGQASAPVFFSYVHPTLTITRSGADIILAWPTNATDYQLEASPALNEAWQLIAPPKTTNAGEFHAVLPVAPTNNFFRLRQF